jgi:hypothetical protein
MSGMSPIEKSKSRKSNEIKPIMKRKLNIDEYEPFPSEVLPEPIGTFVEEAASAIGRDPAFIALPILSALGAAIGTTHCVQLKKGWVEYPIVWTGIVGDSGTKKTPSIKTALRSFNRVQKENHETYCDEMEEYVEKKLIYDASLTAWKAEAKRHPENAGDPPIAPGVPVAKVFLIGDATVESICDLLVRNRRGLLMSRDELAGWINGLDQYKGHKGSDQQLMLEMHSAGSIFVDRKTSGRIHIDTAAVSITGGIQLQILKRIMREEQFENGMMARFLLAHPPSHACTWSEEVVHSEVLNQIDLLVNELFRLSPLQDGTPIILNLNDDAKKVWVRFYDEHNVQTSSQSTSEMKAVFSKLEGYAARFAVIFHCIRRCHRSDNIDQFLIDAESMNSAILLVRWFARETKRIYGMMHESELDRGLRLHYEWMMLNHDDGVVNLRAFYRSKNLSIEEAESIFEGLELAGLGHKEYSEQGHSGGRPSVIFILKNSNRTDKTQLRDGENEGIVSVNNKDLKQI